MMCFTKVLVALTAIVSPLINVASAAMVPTSPDGSTVVRIGANLQALWEKDMTGTWSSVTLQLMSGDNWNMIPVTTIATQIDATSIDSYTFVVPEVTPTSKIYFLQFTPATGNRSDVTWTTRFTISGTDGSTTAPANTTQPNGDLISWGVGTLVSGGTTGSGSTSAGNTTSAESAVVNTATGLVSSAASAAATTSAQVLPDVAASSSGASVMVVSTSAAATTSSPTRTATAAAASTTASTGASSKLQVGLASGVLGGLTVLLALV